MFKPELLSPAGSLDKLKAAINYGADAVYLAGQNFGLRSAADNFTLDELAEGVSFAHNRGAKVYVVLNAFPHDKDMETLAAFVHAISELKVDGVIASDLGVISTVSKNSNLPIHLSTQASCLNKESGKFWKKMGVKRLIFGREVSIQEAGQIKRATGLEVELFIHGSLCMAYSGNCTISNFTKGRDSNRGGCAQSCRFSYALEVEVQEKVNEEPMTNRYFMSSKDLLGLDLLPLFCEEEIDSIKVEGRMRSALYAGLVSKNYREALDALSLSSSQSGNDFLSKLPEWNSELEKIKHRQYTSGSLQSPADEQSVLDRGVFESVAHFEYVGEIRKVEEGRYLLAEVKARFKLGEKIELVPFSGSPIIFSVDELHRSTGKPVEEANVNQLVRLKYFKEAKVGNLLRKLSLS